MLRRLGYILILLVWLTVMALPILAFVLAARGELMVGSDQGNNLRLFMVNTDEAEGIGIQRVRESSSQAGCLQGSIRYFLWEGYGRDLGADYCTCLNPQSGYADVNERCDAK